MKLEKERRCGCCDCDSDPPFEDAQDLLDHIDSIPHGDVPWESFTVRYDGEMPPSAPSWMTKGYEVWYRDPLTILEGQIANADFVGHIDYAPKELRGRGNRRQYVDLMSGEWAWKQANTLAQDPDLHGAMFAPIVLGSDKTTVSVGTGQNEYYPLYISLGNVRNHVRRAHRNALQLLAFLAIPKTGRDEQDSVEFRRFRRQLFHTSLARILMSVKAWMKKARVTQCGDGHFRRVVYGLGPYIADYPEQCLLACVVSGWCPRCISPSADLDGDQSDVFRSHEHTEAIRQAFEGNLKKMWEGYGMIDDVVPFTAYFPRANIHELLSPDLLHQVIKGTFKDHLVSWVVEYLEAQPNGKSLVAEMDRRIAASPLFSGLRRFPEGRGFKQWTGNDSKALMKVFIPAIVGLVPDEMVKAVSCFTEFCYLVRRSRIDELVLDRIDQCIAEFHEHRKIFIDLGIRDDFCLPRQHSLIHYRLLIQQFGAPNGICSSITESKHIKAVKQPWRRSNRNQPLGQMLLTNQRLDKMAAFRVSLNQNGAVPPAPQPADQETEQADNMEDDDDGGMDDQRLTCEGEVRLPRRAGTQDF
ncbi:hypothetical protein EST38_g8794 [Candolleomyces aberdarensis]|uniref:C2H2-type domain-containing protein n=1 Tax=Candolleomyces aberdarensis TaxID=2316362 RepID=A0A4Q2DBK0_9AGAR|nr:hypothetical protein EST38_g8794 [Candolleomyces aberdarensis]